MSRLAVPATMTYKVTGVVCLLVAAGCGLALARTATAFAWSTILDYAVDPKHQLLDYRLPNIVWQSGQHERHGFTLITGQFERP